jgi:hypothetical protein
MRSAAAPSEPSGRASRRCKRPQPGTERAPSRRCASSSDRAREPARDGRGVLLPLRAATCIGGCGRPLRALDPRSGPGSDWANPRRLTGKTHRHGTSGRGLAGLDFPERRSYTPALPGPPVGERGSVSMADNDEHVIATITAELPQRLFRLQTRDGALITAGASTDAARLGIPFRIGMSVTVRRARFDPARGTILAPAQTDPPREKP